MKKLKVCSLFSGIGGFETGLFQAVGKENVEVVFASEIDKYASMAYEKLYNHQPSGDITKIYEGDIPDHDLLVAGFPCQAFSVSGKRLGFEDTRGTLFFEIARIAKEKRPKMMILENVKGLLGHDKGKTFQVIMETLSDLQYAVDFKVLNSKFFDVAQNRERVFIVCHRDIKEEEWVVDKSNNVEMKTKKRLQEIGNIKTFNFSFPVQENVCVCIQDILEEYVSEKYYISTEKSKDFVRKINISNENNIRKIGFLKKDKEQNRVHDPMGIMPTLTSNNQGGRRPGGLICELVIEPPFKEYLTKEIHKIVSKTRPNETISITFKQNGDIRPHRNDPRKSGISELNINYQENPSFTVTASHAPKIYGAKTNWRIRRLSPLECFRLQSFPDSYYHILREIGLSDSQLYKMAGNAVTANVIAALMEEALAYLEK